MARTTRNLTDLPTSTPMRPRGGVLRFRAGIADGHRDGSRRTRQLAEALAAKVEVAR